ncbi:efflux RND transporter periplasmic adaptor subunit [Halomonas aquatica]|uniref:Efflux RND transporter periplasmic adaptor subunit n=1 Tax=Halomonas aquatica TaxID=3151123 RepID=A0ABV1NCZ2_9GAMM
MTRSRTHLSLLIALALLMLSSLLAAQQPTAVIGARASLEPWSDPLEALGTLRADESVTLSSTVTALVAEVSFSDGEEVETGQLLLQLNDSEEQADLRSAQALRDERRNTVTRLNQLESRNLAPRADVEDARSRLRQVEAEIQALEARLANYRILAPFSGRVGFRDISVGTLVTPGTDLVTLDKLDTMTLDFGVPEVSLGMLEPGLSLTATSAAFPNASFDGEIASLGTRVDPVNRNLAVRAELANPELRLRPGMLMQVTLQLSPRNAVVMPEAALIPEGQRQFVLVLQGEGETYRVEKREVRIGARREGEVEILEGLAVDDLVVAHGTERVRDGGEARLIGILDGDTSVPDILLQARNESEKDS